MNRFKDVDLGNDKTMQRMVNKVKKERNDIIEECAKELDNCGHHKAAIILRMMLK